MPEIGQFISWVISTMDAFGILIMVKMALGFMIVVGGIAQTVKLLRG